MSWPSLLCLSPSQSSRKEGGGREGEGKGRKEEEERESGVKEFREGEGHPRRGNRRGGPNDSLTSRALLPCA